MSKIRMLKSLVYERLSSAAEEIFEIFERPVEQYEVEVFRAKQEIDRQRKLLDLVLKHEIKSCGLKADHLQLPVCEEEVHPEQQERSPSLGQEEPEPQQIKEEQEETASSRFTLHPIKCENEEESTQWSQLSQTLKEENRVGDSLLSTSSDQMNTEPDGEDCGVSEPASDIEPARDGQLLSSDCSETETEDSEDYRKVNERLNAAAKEIFGIVKRTVKEYQAEIVCAKQEINRQRQLLDLVLKPEIKLHRADHLQLPVCEVEVHPEQQERSPSLGQEEPEPQQIKEEQEELIQQQEEAASSRFTSQPIKCENEEENTQWSQLSQTFKEENREDDIELARDGQHLSSDCSESETEDSDDYWRETGEPQSGLNSLKSKKTQKGHFKVHRKRGLCGSQTVKEENREGDPPLSTSSDQMNTEPDGEDCGVSEPASDIEPARDDQLPSSHGSGTETEDSDDYCRETREPQSGLNSLKSKRRQTGQRSSTSKKLKRSTESIPELKSTNHIPSTYCCKVCRESFPNIVSLLRHVRVHSKKCGFCEKHLEPTESLSRHLQVHRKCDECGKRFSRNRGLEMHVWIHTRDKPFGCTECGKRFTLKGSLTTHMIGHTGEKPLSCSICNKIFDCRSNIKVHMRCHAGEKPFSCSVCKKSFGYESNMKVHMRCHTGEKPFSCSVCKKSFGVKGTLKRHMSCHIGEKPFSCTVCNKGFGHKSNLNIHMLVHTGEKPFSCSICNISFGVESSLKKHMSCHTGEKPFRCSICNRDYGLKSYLKTHMRFHMGEKPFSCSVCNKCFKHNSSLKVHMRCHTGEKPFSCSICNKSFGYEASLKVHMRCHTGEKPFSCSICNNGYGRKSYLTTHMSCHTGEKPFSCSVTKA